MDAIGYCNADRVGPSLGSVSSSIIGSRHAQSGSKFAITPRDANRDRSTPCTTWVWAITGLRSRGPLRAAAASIASRAMRTPPSPIAWMWIWNPSASKAVTASDSSSGDQFGSPQVCGASSYGSRRNPVPISMTPSAKNLIVPARRKSFESSACASSSRRCTNPARSRFHREGSARSAMLTLDVRPPERAAAT